MPCWIYSDILKYDIVSFCFYLPQNVVSEKAGIKDNIFVIISVELFQLKRPSILTYWLEGGAKRVLTDQNLIAHSARIRIEYRRGNVLTRHFFTAVERQWGLLKMQSTIICLFELQKKPTDALLPKKKALVFEYRRL